MIGCLIEKQLTTPQQYPLTLNALVLACNQTSNRDPVLAYEEILVQRTLASLKEAGLVRFVYPSSGRSATRYRQVLGESLGLDEKGIALVAVLLLRGPQTAGELRTRTERMASFDGLGAVNAELEAMGAHPDPLVLQLPRRPGQKEERWRQLLTVETPVSDVFASLSGDERAYPGLEFEDRPGSPGQGAGATTERDERNIAHDLSDRVGAKLSELEDDLAGLRGEVAELRAVVGQLQSQLSP